MNLLGTNALCPSPGVGNNSNTNFPAKNRMVDSFGLNLLTIRYDLHQIIIHLLIVLQDEKKIFDTFLLIRQIKSKMSSDLGSRELTQFFGRLFDVCLASGLTSFVRIVLI